MIEFIIINKPYKNVIIFSHTMMHVWRTINCKRWFEWDNFNLPNYNYPTEDQRFISFHISDDLKKNYLIDNSFSAQTLYNNPLLLCYIDIL